MRKRMDFSSSGDKVADGERPSPPKSRERVLKEWTSFKTSDSRGWLEDERMLERKRRRERRFELRRRGAGRVSHGLMLRGAWYIPDESVV
jgi:hypothetical protein